MLSNMTQDKKDLLLKDLCARLPYGVIVETPKGKGHVCDINLTIFGTEVGVNINATSRDKFNIEDIKPYLIPLSSMTDKQKEEEKHLKEELYSFDANGNVFTLQDFYNKNHIDFRGLIPMDLAIDATGLNIY